MSKGKKKDKRREIELADCGPGCCGFAETETVAGTVTTAGTGAASAAPDLMRVTVSVEARADTVVLAYGTAGERVTAITESLRADGVPGSDIATTGLSVRTETEWTEQRGQRITGYVAATDLTVALRSIGESADPSPADIIAHCVEAGGDEVRLNGLTLGFADEAALLRQARDAAWDDALAKAEQYAARAGTTLGPVLEITEDSGPRPPRPVARARAAMIAESASVPVELGASEVAASIRVTWQLV
ncbi:SIMPL domain-containing protein [Nocardia sp. NPDC127579]|uniref:SIMPL domain-containing protein n=1 Tax=Nocardia sp. NPDC127579 TaxID=3345402 RepID=UPI003628F6D5